MDDFFADYLDQAMEQVRWRRARPALAQELRTHLLDQRDACLAQGMSQTEAEAESLRQMGDPVEVGTQLDRVHRPAPLGACWPWLGCCCAPDFSSRPP